MQQEHVYIGQPFEDTSSYLLMSDAGRYENYKLIHGVDIWHLSIMCPYIVQSRRQAKVGERGGPADLVELEQ